MKLVNIDLNGKGNGNGKVNRRKYVSIVFIVEALKNF